MTILGTRPEIIRLSLVIKLLDQYSERILVDTGQNYDDRLSGLFFRELQMGKPNVSLGVDGLSFGEQVGQILSRIELVLKEHKPDRVLVLGDTNSGLAAIVARRLGILCTTWKQAIAVTTFAFPRKAIAALLTMSVPFLCRIQTAAGRICSARA